MLRGEVGMNHAAFAERLLFVTTRPQDPHSPLPDNLETTEVFKRWQWPHAMQCTLPMLGLHPGAADPHQASRTLKMARAEGEDTCPSDDEGEGDSNFVPDASGYLISFADGTGRTWVDKVATTFWLKQDNDRRACLLASLVKREGVA